MSRPPYQPRNVPDAAQLSSEDMRSFCASQLKVLAEPSRLGVIERLASGPKAVRELQEELSLEQSLLSHHLRILRDAGLVYCERDGKSIIYSLASFVHFAKSDSREGGFIDLGCCKLVF